MRGVNGSVNIDAIFSKKLESFSQEDSRRVVEKESLREKQHCRRAHMKFACLQRIAGLNLDCMAAESSKFRAYIEQRLEQENILLLYQSILCSGDSCSLFLRKNPVGDFVIVAQDSRYAKKGFGCGLDEFPFNARYAMELVLRKLGEPETAIDFFFSRFGANIKSDI